MYQWVETCRGEGLYLVMEREWNNVCTIGYYTLVSFKWVARNEATRAIPANDLNNHLAGQLAVDRYVQASLKPLDRD